MAGSGAADRQSALDAATEQRVRAYIRSINRGATALIAARAVMAKIQSEGRDVPAPLRSAWGDSKLALANLVWPICRALPPGEFTFTLPNSARLGTPCETVISDEEFAARLDSGNPGRFQIEPNDVSGDLGVVFLLALVPYIPVLVYGTIAVFAVSAIGHLADVLGPEAFAAAATMNAASDGLREATRLEAAGTPPSAAFYAALGRQQETAKAAAESARRAQCKGFVDCFTAQLAGPAAKVAFIGGIGLLAWFAGPPIVRAISTRAVSKRNSSA